MLKINLPEQNAQEFVEGLIIMEFAELVVSRILEADVRLRLNRRPRLFLRPEANGASVVVETHHVLA